LDGCHYKHTTREVHEIVNKLQALLSETFDLRQDSVVPLAEMLAMEIVEKDYQYFCSSLKISCD